MEAWRNVWRNALEPLLNDRQLEVLRTALLNDDHRLVQGATTSPPPLHAVQDWPVEAACVIGFCGWQGADLETVGEVEEFFAKTCFEMDQRMGEPAGCRWLLNFWDETPREAARAALLGEVNRSLARRMENEATPSQQEVTTA